MIQPLWDTWTKQCVPYTDEPSESNHQVSVQTETYSTTPGEQRELIGGAECDLTTRSHHSVVLLMWLVSVQVEQWDASHRGGSSPTPTVFNIITSEPPSLHHPASLSLSLPLVARSFPPAGSFSPFSPRINRRLEQSINRRCRGNRVVLFQVPPTPPSLPLAFSISWGFGSMDTTLEWVCVCTCCVCVF